MRKIKVRVWDKKKSVMIYFNRLGVSSTGDFWDGKREEVNYEVVADRDIDSTKVGYNHSDFNEAIQQDDAEFMLYIGLKNKNGVEIYEGDIFTTHAMKPRVVAYKDAGFGYDAMGDFIGFAGHNHFKMLMAQIEVIGNIYENPELLEKNG